MEWQSDLYASQSHNTSAVYARMDKSLHNNTTPVGPRVADDVAGVAREPRDGSRAGRQA